MSKTSLRFLAVLLTFLIIVVLAAGLDDLPRALRDRIDGEQKALNAAQEQVARTRTEVDRDLRAEPRLFAAGGLATALPARIARAESELTAAAADANALAALRKANRREDKDRAAALLAKVERGRNGAANEAQVVQAEAQRRMEFKLNLPATLRRMEQNRQRVSSLDLSPVVAAVARAGSDWPEKKADLESRLASLQAIPAAAETQWQSSAAARTQAAAGDWDKFDPAVLLAASDSLDRAAVTVPAKATELKALTDQLYTSWDKILVDLEERRHGNERDYLEKLRTVRARLLDPAAKKSDTSSEEKWVEVSRAEYQAVEKNLGMAIEHKGTGKYDSEAERVAQPAGLAYMASPTQRSNQYGYWENRGGQSFWVWYGQYALLRDLLFNRDYRPTPARDYDGYWSARNGGYTYYGRGDDSPGSSTPKYGTQGSSTQSRYSGSTYMRSGGFKDSQYATRSGGYRDSQFSSPSYRRHDDQPAIGGRSSSGSGGSSGFSRPGGSGRTFGGSSRSGRSSSGGGGRRFGGGGRRR